MSNAIELLIENWVSINGGFRNKTDDTRAHSLKLLEEVVELCIASGAIAADMLRVVDTEVAKAIQKTEYGQINPNGIGEEVADSAICLHIYAYHCRIHIADSICKKLPVLYKRDFVPNSQGVLMRPDRVRNY